MIFVKVKNTLYPATVSGRMSDKDWDNRESKSITLEMDFAIADDTFVDGLKWSIVQQEEKPVFDEEGKQTGTEIKETEFDNSEYNLAGDITDHRDGRVTVKMGKLTDLEKAYEKIYGGI